jgi:Na+/melibiose symporter-like transporter
MAIATLFNWLAAFVVSLTFPTLTAFAGAGTVFLVYAAVGVVIFPIVWWMVPETKERSLESLEAEFRNGVGSRVR